jgi:ABC-type nitrate/sulfonate/bicarbonate transport system substrate-binding protein
MTDRPPLGRRDVLRYGAAALVGGAGLLVGCHSSKTTAPDAGGSALKSVNIVNTASNNTYTLQELLNQLGYLRDLSLQANTVNVADGSKLIGALLSGSSDICILAGFGQVLPAIEKGGKLKVLAGAGLLDEHAIYSAKPEIRKVKDLEGKTVATGSPGALLHQLVVAVLHKKGVDLKRVTFVNVGSSADVFRAVVAKTVDAGPALTDVYDQQAKYGVHSLADGDLWDELPEFTYQGSFTSTQAIADKRDVLVRTLAAYCKLYRYVQSPDSKDAFIRAREAALNNTDPQEGESEWKFIQTHKPYAVDLILSEERIRYMQNLNLELGVQQNSLSFEQVADMSLARDAVRLLL